MWGKLNCCLVGIGGVLVGGGVKFYPKIFQCQMGDYPPFLGIYPLYKGGYPGWGGGMGLSQPPPGGA